MSIKTLVFGTGIAVYCLTASLAYSASKQPDDGRRSSGAHRNKAR